MHISYQYLVKLTVWYQRNVMVLN